jgi:hypothetical protein
MAQSIYSRDEAHQVLTVVLWVLFLLLIALIVGGEALGIRCGGSCFSQAAR